MQECAFNKRTIKICVSCWCRRPETSAPRAAHLTVSLYPCSSRSNAQGPWRVPCQLKMPLRVWDGDKGGTGRNYRKERFPDEGHWFALPANQWSFKKETEKKLSKWLDLALVCIAAVSGHLINSSTQLPFQPFKKRFEGQTPERRQERKRAISSLIRGHSFTWRANEIHTHYAFFLPKSKH